MLHKKLLKSADKTTQLAQAFAPFLKAGHTILLRGPVGAGKTHFARQLILTRMAAIGAIEDIPSPTFTLIQTYELGSIDIWHADLYRLSDPSEVYELGLDAAFDSAICLVEWPDRLGELSPQNALTLTFDVTKDDERIAQFEWQADHWTTIIQSVEKAF